MKGREGVLVLMRTCKGPCGRTSENRIAEFSTWEKEKFAQLPYI